jgi:ABC-type dipeptide/oligopeptide/nickel transport system permease subunit
MTEVSPAPARLTSAAETLDDTGVAVVAKSFGRQTWERFLRHKLAVGSVIMLVLMTAIAFIGPHLWKWNFSDTNVPDRAQGMSWNHPMGTDTLGRDTFAQVMEGYQISIQTALLVAVLSSVVGAMLGIVAGYFGKWVDIIIGQLVNLFLVVPALLVLLVLSIKYNSAGGVFTTAIVIALLSWVPITRIVRGQILQLKQMEYVQAAKAAGAGSGRIMLRHLLPNVLGAVFVQTTLVVGTAIVLEATLSFLGNGVQPPNTSLGNLIQDGKGSIYDSPSKVLWPGGIVVMIVLCINFLGDGLRDAFDPTSRKSRE